MTDQELLKEIELQRDLMINVATSDQPIARLNAQYITRRAEILIELSKRGLAEPTPYEDLWAWRGKWSSGDLPTYKSRREFVSELYRPLMEQINLRRSPEPRVFEEPTGWARIDRDLGELRSRLEQARTEVQFQSVGHICREILISLAQEAFDPSKHRSVDSVDPSTTDAKRMLDAYIATELAGSSNEAVRRHAKAALDVSNDLQHRRTAGFRGAALCAEATTSVVNLIAIISGRRDP